MYESGQGVYPSTAGSFYNVNSVYSPMDNGRAAPQISAPAAYVPIYNPTTDMGYLHSQAQQAAVGYTGQNTGLDRNFYDTKIMNAGIYASAQSEMSARNTSRYLGYASTATSVGSAIGGMMMGAGIFNPVMLAATAASYAMDAGQSYFSGYSDRMGDIKNIREMYSHVRSGALVDPVTGAVSNAAASRVINALDMTAAGSNFTSKDIRDIHGMAGQMGMMQGHTGSASDIASRVKQLANLTQSIMELGDGISPQDAMEMQRMSEAMGVSLTKFKNLNMAKQVITASKLAGQTIEATSQAMGAMAQTSAAAGLGGQLGAETYLFSSNMAQTGFGNLTAAQQAAVGGSAQAYGQRVATAQLSFAQRNAQALAMGSYYVDPATGSLKIDRGELQRMVEEGFDPEEANKRGFKLFSGITDRKTRSMVQSIVARDAGRLSQEAISSMDPSTLLALQAQEVVRVAREQNTLDVQGVARQLYGENASAIMTQIQNYGSGRINRIESARRSRLSEMDAQGRRGFTPVTEYLREEAGYFERLGRSRADRAAMEEDILRREAVDQFGVGRVTYTSADYADLLSGNVGSRTALQRRNLRGGLYDRTLEVEGRVSGSLAARRMRDLFDEDTFGPQSALFFEDEGIGAVGEFLYGEGVFTEQSAEDLATSIYGRGSRSAGSRRLRLLGRLREQLREANDGRGGAIGFGRRDEIGRIARRLRGLGMGDSDLVRRSLRMANAGSVEEFAAQGLGATENLANNTFRQQVELAVANSITGFTDMFGIDRGELELSSADTRLVNLAERMGNRFIAEGAATSADQRTLSDGRDIYAAGPAGLADEMIVKALAQDMGTTPERARRVFRDMSSDRKESLRRGFYATAQGRTSSNVKTFLARGARKGMTMEGMIAASGEVDYTAIQSESLRVITGGYTGVGGQTAKTSIEEVSANELVLGRTGDVSEQEFKTGLQSLGGLFTDLGNSLGALAQGVRDYANKSGENYTNPETLVRDYLEQAPEGLRKSVASLSSAKENQLIDYLKQIATRTKSDESAIGSATDISRQINRFGRLGATSRSLEMTEQLLKDNPLAKLFSGTTSRKRAGSAMDFFNSGGLKLSSSAAGGLDVDSMLTQGLGSQFGDLDLETKNQLRKMVSDVFGSVSSNDPQALAQANKEFKQRLIKMLQSADSASAPTQSGGGTLQEAAAKINALIDASSSIIKAMANTNVEEAKKQLAEAIDRINTATASPSQTG